jgi:predicted nucleotidyltransferase component of viral defense system
MKLKVEVNSREHLVILGWNSVPFSIESLLFKGKANITTYKLEELLGTKMRALYQRSKGRDLYDLYKFLATYHLNTDQIIQCYKMYIEFSLRDREKHPPTKKQFENNLKEKLKLPAASSGVSF